MVQLPLVPEGVLHPVHPSACPAEIEVLAIEARRCRPSVGQRLFVRIQRAESLVERMQPGRVGTQLIAVLAQAVGEITQRTAIVAVPQPGHFLSQRVSLRLEPNNFFAQREALLVVQWLHLCRT
jgi:hypothetical protein